MSLVPGNRLGPYEITAQIGAGGMGEVWRATDTNLGRQVAIKVLPDAFAHDPERLARFEREAKTLASLNHPSIAGIYGLEKTDGISALVMELVEGPTLVDRIAQGPLRLEEARPIARQIADALEAAHEQGIIHRDIKPANIKLRPDGTVKVLDFGLAKAVSGEPGPQAMTAISHSPTLMSPGGMTGIGVILGTAAYMSPEQARGKAIDKRADVWAFGCVFYEMLTGRQAFPGETVTDVLAAVLNAAPDWSALPDSTPPAIGHLVRRCLQKDCARRLHDIGDARIEIEETIAAGSTGSAAVASHRRGSPRVGRVPWAVAVLFSLTTLLALLAPWRTEGPIENREVARVELNFPHGVELMSGANAVLAISPDGQRLAFVGMQNGLRRTYIRRLSDVDVRPVEGTEGAISCFFSPDGHSLGIVTNAQQVKTVSLSDGLVSTVATGADVLSGAAWSPRGRIVYVHGATLWEVPARGGTANQLTRLDDTRREIAHTGPIVLPDGNGILFTVQIDGTTNIDALTVATGARTTVVEQAEGPLYAASGHLVFFRDGDLVAQQFDADSMMITGSPVRLPEPVQASTLQAASPLTISPIGSLVYRAASQAAETRLVWVSRRGAEELLTTPPGRYLQPRFSPDGRSLAVWLDDELRILDLLRGTFERVIGAEKGAYPVWMPDGKRIVFSDLRGGIRWVAANGDGSGGTVAGTTPSDLLSSASPDGQMLAFLRFGQDSSADIYVTSLQGDPPPRPLIKTPAYEGGARFSPDGRWLAYVSDESGEAQVYLRPFRGPDRKWPVSTSGGTQPVWSRNGKELYYREGDMLMAVEVSMALDPSMSQPTPLFQRPYAFGPTIGVANYDVAPDGERFVMVREAPGSSRLTLVLNWFEELKRLVPKN